MQAELEVNKDSSENYLGVRIYEAVGSWAYANEFKRK